jgi:hypothetical protein
MLRFVDQELELPSLQPEAPSAPFDASKLEQDLGDQAGLKPLPLERMFQQAGRPMSPNARGQSETRREGGFWYGKNKSLKVDPALHDLTIQRNQRAQQAVQDWNPVEAENKQRLNNTNPSPRSKPSAADDKTTINFFQRLAETTSDRMRAAFHDDLRSQGLSGLEYRKAYDAQQDVRYASDKSDFLSPQERNAAKSAMFSYLDRKAGGRDKATKQDLPIWIQGRFPGLANDMLYEWNARRARQLREGTLDMLEIRRDTIRGI